MAKAIFTRYKLDAEGDRVELPLDAPWDEEENDSLVNFSDPLNKPWTRYCGCRDMKENLGYCVNCGYKIQPEPTSPSVVPCLQCSRHEADAERLAKENRELKEEVRILQLGLRMGRLHKRIEELETTVERYRGF